jgi:hypothetical protein
MSLKLLIDECLSPELVEMAVQAGYLQSTCVRDRGWSGTKDWMLIGYAVEADYTLVTHNAVDFRGDGPANLGGHHARQAIHAGLVCLNSYYPMDLDRQRDLFRVALDELARLDDLVNQALEVFELSDGSIELEIYDIRAGA